MNNNIATKENTSNTEKQFLNNIFVKAEFIKTKLNNKQIIENLCALQEDSRYSPTKSNMIVKEIEDQILSILDEIILNIDYQNNENIFSNISNCRNLLKQRNLLLKKS